MGVWLFVILCLNVSGGGIPSLNWAFRLRENHHAKDGLTVLLSPRPVNFICLNGRPAVGAR
jgi:hypothetical protein